MRTMMRVGMRIQITPAYLGLKAGQSERSKRRGRSKKVWQTRTGLRLPVTDMTDYHLTKVMIYCYNYARSVKMETWKNRDFILYKASIVSIIRKELITFPALVREGYKRGLIHSSGYPTPKGFLAAGYPERNEKNA